MDRELALRLDDGTVIYDSGWRCVADVMKSFNGFGVNRVYGTLIYAETGEIYQHHTVEHTATQRTNSPLG